MADHQPPFVIHVDGKEFTVDQSTLTGAQIKALVGKGSTQGLLQEMIGDHPDKTIPDGESVRMRNGKYFYTAPLATLGRQPPSKT